MNDEAAAVTRSRSDAVVRTALFWSGFLVLAIAMGGAKWLAPEAWRELVWGLSSSVLVFGLTLAFLRRDGRTLSDVGLQFSASSLGRFGIGVALSVGLYGLTLGVLHVVAGPLAFGLSSPPNWATVGMVGAIFLFKGLMEELAFRGYALRTLVPAIGEGWAQAVVAFAFAATHLLYGWSWESILFGVLPSGFLYGAAAVASRGLAMPLGIHVAANWFQWVIGEEFTPGFWFLDVPDDVLARVAAWAPSVGLVLTAAFTVAIWVWHYYRGPRRLRS